MFGYIKPFKPQLKMCEYDFYKAIYCGLCGQLGKSFGPAARLTLSYDFTFLCMLHYGISGKMPDIAVHRCYVNPMKKQPTCGESAQLLFSADMAILMLYYKLLDNIQDGGAKDKLLYSMARPIAAGAHKQAAARRPEGEQMLAVCMQRQNLLEQQGCGSVDEASEPTAQALSGICMLLSENPKQQRVLQRLGYLVGRFVYLCDALDDLEKDIAAGGYNPLVLRHQLTQQSSKQDLDKVYVMARESLYATIAETAKAYDLLDITAFHPVLENIITMGMRASVHEILSKKEQNA